jgi:hypothetical protein
VGNPVTMDRAHRQAGVILPMLMLAATLPVSGLFAQQSGAATLPLRSECYARAAAFNAYPGFENVADAATKLNAADAAGKGEALARYDTLFAQAIGRFATSEKDALQLVRIESLVDRIGACALSLNLDPEKFAQSNASLNTALARNIAFLQPTLPPENLPADERKNWHNRFNSDRVRTLVAAQGKASEIAQIEATLEQRQIDAFARAEAAWQAGEPQRIAEAKARWAEQDAIAARQRSDAAIPDEQLIRR